MAVASATATAAVAAMGRQRALLASGPASGGTTACRLPACLPAACLLPACLPLTAPTPLHAPFPVQ
jgi:hypothetical protein